MGWKTFNDRLALFLMVVIPALWLLTGMGIAQLPEAVVGATILQWGLVIQYYFRKKETE